MPSWSTTTGSALTDRVTSHQSLRNTADSTASPSEDLLGISDVTDVKKSTSSVTRQPPVSDTSLYFSSMTSPFDQTSAAAVSTDRLTSVNKTMGKQNSSVCRYSRHSKISPLSNLTLVTLRVSRRQTNSNPIFPTLYIKYACKKGTCPIVIVV